MHVIIKKHCVARLESGLSPLQQNLLSHEAHIRIVDAPTGAGKTYAFQQGLMLEGQRILFIVPTRRLAQNIAGGLVNDLIKAGSSGEVAEKQVAIWSSDEGARLQEEQGIQNIRGYRINQIQVLNPTRPEIGEMIVAVPEVLSHLLLARRLDMGQSSMGVFDVLDAFDHIVFDEFHTIEAQGFGMAALLASLAPHFGRAKVSLLSATPVNVKPVLLKLGVKEEHIAELEEEIVEKGRPLHGDVELSLEDAPDLHILMKNHINLVKQEVSSGRQVVVIYNSLRDLRDHLHLMATSFKSAGITPSQVLVINSIDDSGGNGILSCGFSVGQKQNPDNFSILIATASVEMGVTFREANVMLMESGFEPMNFLQRYGRAARRGKDGQVIVRMGEDVENRNFWLRELKKWVQNNSGSKKAISELANVLSRTLDLKAQSESDTSYFGEMGSQAVYTAGLYWQVLMNHKANNRYQKQHLLGSQPNSRKQIYGLLKSVQKLQDNFQFTEYCKEWIKRFYGLALQYRDIGQKVTVIEGNGRRLQVGRLWLERETDILSRPRQDDEGGNEYYEIRGELDDYLLDTKNRARRRLTCYFPHMDQIDIEAGTGLVNEWGNHHHDKRNFDTEMAWDNYPESMKAAEALVRLTGLVPAEESIVSDATVDWVM